MAPCGLSLARSINHVKCRHVIAKTILSMSGISIDCYFKKKLLRRTHRKLYYDRTCNIICPTFLQVVEEKCEYEFSLKFPGKVGCYKIDDNRNNNDT